MASSTEGAAALKFPWMTVTSPTFTNFTLDVSGERFGFVFRVPKTGTLKYLRFRIASIVSSAAIRAGVYAVDVATGFPTTQIPGSSNGTVTPTAPGQWDITLSAGASVTVGDVVAVVVEFDSTIGNLGVGRYATNLPFPYAVSFNGTSWSKAIGQPAMVIGYDDDTYPMFDGVQNPSFASVTYNPASTPYDEYGLAWTPAAPVRLKAVMAYLALVSANGNYDLVLYQGTTALATKSVDGHVLSLITGTQHQVSFDTPINLTAGQQYRLVIKPTVASQGVQLWYSGIASAAELNAWNGPDYYLTRRVDGGAWSDDSGAVPWISPIFDQIDDGTGPDITGTYTISGVVTQAGNPVSGATVRLIRQSDNGIASTTTNAQGQYSFSVASGHLYHAIAEWTDGGQKYNAKSLWDLTPVAP